MSYVTPTVIAGHDSTHVNPPWSIARYESLLFGANEVLVKVDVALDPAEPRDREQLAAMRDALTDILEGRA